MPRPKYVRIRNIDGSPQTVVDLQLPNGGVTLGPGEETSIPVEVYMRQRRKTRRWMLPPDRAPEARAAEAVARAGDPPATRDEATAAMPSKRRTKETRNA